MAEPIGVVVDRLAMDHLGGVIVVGPSNIPHVAVDDDADTALVHWVTQVAANVRAGLGLDDAQAIARQQLLPLATVTDDDDDGTTRCATVTAGMAGVPVEVVRRRLGELGTPCCPGMSGMGGAFCVPAIADRSNLRLVLIQS
jgi:hypothetical protein